MVVPVGTKSVRNSADVGQESQTQVIGEFYETSSGSSNSWVETKHGTTLCHVEHTVIKFHTVFLDACR